MMDESKSRQTSFATLHFDERRSAAVWGMNERGVWSYIPVDLTNETSSIQSFPPFPSLTSSAFKHSIGV